MTTKRRGTAFLAVLAASALTLAACGSDDDGEEAGANRSETEEPAQESEGTVPGSTITVAVNEDYTAYNDDTATGNGTWNTLINNGVKNKFWSYGADGGVVRNEDFGTYELVSEDPLTVEYTVSDESVWSDGTPIDCADILLEWAALSGTMVDAAGENIFNSASNNGYELIEKPDCAAGDKEFTAVYTQPYIDWELIFEGGNIPAHVAAQQGGLTEEELITAIQNDDIAALTPVAEWWSNGWQFNPGELPDPALIPSSGPYLLTDWVAGQSITLTANPEYYGAAPATETIVLRVLDGAQQVAALQNGEVDVINPSNPTVDMVSQLESMGEQIEILQGGNLTWSHIDFQMGAGRPFEQLEVRQAFAKCVPRELIVENLVRPANPDAVVQDMREFFPVDEDYDAARDAAFPEDMYGEQDIAGAQDLLTQAGVTQPHEIVLMHADDPVRNDLAALVKDACDEAGFNVVDFTPPDWGERMTSDIGSYDAVMFGWAGSGNLASGQSLYVTGGDQNPYGYSNPRVDELWNEAVSSADREAAREVLAEMETELWNDVFSIPLYTNANVVAVTSGIGGVEVNAAQTGVTFNMDEWIPAQ